MCISCCCQDNPSLVQVIGSELKASHLKGVAALLRRSGLPQSAPAFARRVLEVGGAQSHKGSGVGTGSFPHTFI